MKRLLVFDLLRIFACCLVVFGHAVVNPSVGIYGIFNPSVATWGVILFIFISGALLEYTYGNTVQDIDYVAFIRKRLLRIYPAYWLSIVVTVILFPTLLYQNTIVEWARTASGFYALTIPSYGYYTTIGGEISAVGWFVGLIICLYLLYPFVSMFLRDYKISGLAVIFFLSWFVNYTAPNIAISFPLARLIEFALGIYIIQLGLYPSFENTSRVVRFCSNMTYPIFLIHYQLLGLTSNPILYVVVVLAFSFVIYILTYLFDMVVDVPARNGEQERRVYP